MEYISDTMIITYQINIIPLLIRDSNSLIGLYAPIKTDQLLHLGGLYMSIKPIQKIENFDQLLGNENTHFKLSN